MAEDERQKALQQGETLEEWHDARSQATFSYAKISIGPLPPPEVLAEYEELGYAERIVRMAEKEQDQRFSVETKGVDAEISKEKRGQAIGTFLVTGLLACGFYLLTIGQSVAGLVALVTAATGLAGTFLLARLPSKESAEASLQKQDE
jgi:uncharacterized membrane protein